LLRRSATFRSGSDTAFLTWGFHSMEIFDQDTGLPVLLRALHVLAGVAWIGLLYYFNVVQVPAFASYGDEARARNVSIAQLANRALWWFRWAAVATLVLGLLITGATEDYFQDFMTGDSYSVAHNSAILVGMLFGITMAANVWMVIWKNQKVVIANAANLVAGGEADPAAAGAARSAALASRTNFILSFSMLWFMVGASHLYLAFFDGDSAGKAWVFVLLAIILGGALELLALGYIGGKAATNKLLWPFESHKNALITGGVLWLVLYILSEILLKS
jgi:uncharacterized membrane protein